MVGRFDNLLKPISIRKSGTMLLQISHDITSWIVFERYVTSSARREALGSTLVVAQYVVFNCFVEDRRGVYLNFPARHLFEDNVPLMLPWTKSFGDRFRFGGHQFIMHRGAAKSVVYGGELPQLPAGHSVSKGRLAYI